MKIVRERYPVAELPEDLRKGFRAYEYVRVTIELYAADDEAQRADGDQAANHRAFEKSVKSTCRDRSRRDD